MSNKETLPSYNLEEVEQLAHILDRFGLTRIDCSCDNAHIVLEKTPVSPVVYTVGTEGNSTATPNQAHPGIPATQTINETAGSMQNTGSQPADAKTVVPAPLVGVAYRSQEPGAEPFVKVGDEVVAGTVLCLIEAMKMFNEVKAPVSGKITNIHFEDAKLVEFGAPLFSLD